MSSRVAIVTGAARGIGAATARRLAADGMAVAVLDLIEESCAPVVEGISAAGGRALAVGADVADEAAVIAAVDRVAAELGAPTVLVNNAGIIRDDVLHKMSVDSWDAVMGVHLRGAFLTAMAGQTAVGRVGTPEDIAAAVSYFCSEEAGFVTGQVLYVAGAPVG